MSGTLKIKFVAKRRRGRRSSASGSALPRISGGAPRGVKPKRSRPIVIR